MRPSRGGKGRKIPCRRPGAAAALEEVFEVSRAAIVLAKKENAVKDSLMYT